MKTYQEQAQAFLDSTNTKFEAKFIRHGKYFEDDKDERDIYQITLTRNSRSFSFEFGQSIVHSGKWIMDVTGEGYVKGQHLSDEQYKKARSKFSFGGWGKWCSKNSDFQEPGPYDILACVTKCDPGSFENFCADYGYDTDSRKAEKTYVAVKNEYTQLCTLFSDVEMQMMAEIQ